MKRPLAVLSMLALAVVACSADSDEVETTSAPATPVELTFRVWDDSVVEAYTESLDAFTAANPHVTVTLEVVDLDTYWVDADRDRATGDLPDLMWVDPANITDFVGHDLIVPITMPATGWQKELVDLFTRDGDVWAVPQMWSAVALYYNQDLYDVDTRIETLAWAPDGGDDDTLIDVAAQLTVDEEGVTATEDDFDEESIVRYGYSVDTDLKMTFVPFVAQAGGALQDESGHLTFSSSEGEEAAQYLVDLIHVHHVSPGVDVATDTDALKSLFTSGELVLYQGDSHALSQIAAESDFRWGVAPIVGGPEGKISVLDGVGVAGHAASAHPDETMLVLEWLGSARGQEPLATHGLGFPASTSAQDVYVNYWTKDGVDVSVFLESANNAVTIQSDDVDIHPALEIVEQALRPILLAEVDVETGLAEAEAAGNASLR